MVRAAVSHRTRHAQTYQLVTNTTSGMRISFALYVIRASNLVTISGAALTRLRPRLQQYPTLRMILHRSSLARTYHVAGTAPAHTETQSIAQDGTVDAVLPPSPTLLTTAQYNETTQHVKTTQHDETTLDTVDCEPTLDKHE
ncbi:hypothetical protein SARC_05722 [Sphaeroforma arctica JP610]|uniref:Uncharacterized protein n=1 Tax=Sphaeroforma arctica JP610 TaxID=667725 RepID=A0A0L0G1B1_9EUKA|nr:hypothetical protein SARC_05722 [Sphaeroforma arctica JP610]KNC81993.1 hypothetical protein SARC_05722 [Sphaeroforma arctica JP610]|eukprot:XP_014155895.1 hypothetical protein SARC_05722 [Sphaeroforma arctica JP610]